ncbi:OadG family protein [Geomonas sp. Red32]|uniref:OadG family protein n=1 Tax=Geomonas sp. Red32 TaxID=2912856 RepID=UPI00202CAB6F|nr:OadG family protein [Geomonas sp. Red32]MCM0080525.1 OadG family protein [Geomonas sp. Red32]
MPKFFSRLGEVFRHHPKEPEPEVTTPTEPEAPATIHPGLTDQQLVAILTAAACEVLQAPVRIGKVHALPPRNWSWVAQGRMDLHSHRPRK